MLESEPVMLGQREREEIERLWRRKVEQDSLKIPQSERHRNLEPSSAEFIYALASGIGAKEILEIGGSSGISTIALAAAARGTSGHLVSIERESTRQAEARETLARLELAAYVDFILDDAASVLAALRPVEFAFIDCEKEDYVRFFEMLRLEDGAVVVADNIISHDMSAYVAHVRSLPHMESMTLPIGKGLEVSRFPGRRA